MALRIEPSRRGSGGQPEVSVVARYLRDVLGPNLTVALAGVRDVKAVDRWASGGRAPRPRAEKRLRDAHRVAEVLIQAESPESVRSWFLGMNPALEDRAPAVVLSEDPEAVLHAARFFVANG